MDYLSRVLNSAAVVDPEAQIEDIADALAGYGNFAAAIGKRLGELHAILAAPTDDLAGRYAHVDLKKPGDESGSCAGVEN